MKQNFFSPLRLRIVSFLLPLFLFGNILEVELPTQNLVKPLYIGVNKLSSTIYTEKLKEVLEFDIQNGGAISVEREEGPEGSFRYILSMSGTDKQLLISLFDVEKKATKTYPPLSLTGDLSKDRRAIHQFSDKWHQEVFGISGIASQKILYTQRTSSPPWHSEIWMADADGANAVQLTHTNGYCLSPGFLSTASGEEEFFYVFHDAGQSKIYRASFSQPDAAKPLFAMRGNQMLPALPRSGRQIAFIADLTGRPDLFLQSLNAKGEATGKPRQLFSAPRATQASPTFSPDGTRLAFVSDKDGTPRIYLIDLQASKPKPLLLTKTYRDNSAPSWSPDGKKIAYAAKVDGVRQICVFDFATGTETPLTTGPETKENPTWAPNSLHILYNTENTNCELYLLVPGSLQSVQISKGAGQKRFGSWKS